MIGRQPTPLWSSELEIIWSWRATPWFGIARFLTGSLKGRICHQERASNPNPLVKNTKRLHLHPLRHRPVPDVVQVNEALAVRVVSISRGLVPLVKNCSKECGSISTPSWVAIRAGSGFGTS